MKYYLVHIDLKKKTFSLVKEISGEMFNEYSVIDSRINNYYRSFSLIKFPELAFTKLENCFNKTIKSMQELDYDREVFLNISFELEFHLINYLTNFRIYLDHTETRLKRDYKDGGIIELFKKSTNNFFDETFSYPFIYQLRNFVQHCSIPFSPEKIDYLKKDTTEVERSTADIFFDRDGLLENFKKWKKIVAEKIRAQGEKIELISNVQESLFCLQELEGQIKESEIKILTSKAERLIEICQPVLQNNGTPGIASLEEVEGHKNKYKSSMLSFPFGALISMGFNFAQVKE